MFWRRELFLDEEYISKKIIADINLAKDELDTAKILFNSNKYRQSITHSYYAMFQAATALLTKKNIVAKSHESLIMLFGKEYLKTNIFDNNIFSFLTNARVNRRDSSYDSFATFHKKDAQIILENAEIFIQEVEKFI